MLQAINLTKRYEDGQLALDNLNLDIRLITNYELRITNYELRKLQIVNY
jgi:hypothetical protein